MCGRFAFFMSADDLEDLVPGIEIPYWPGIRYNIAPSVDILTVLNDGTRRSTPARWGMIPSWAKDPSMGNRLINARVETVSEKPSFKKPFLRQRCIIPASGFYEWKSEGKLRNPFFIRHKSGKPVAFAGLWDRWRSPEGKMILSAAIITTSARGAVEPIHGRMPLIIPRENISDWLDTADRAPDTLMNFIASLPPTDLEARAVSRTVNNPSNEGPSCIETKPDDMDSVS